MGIMVKMNKNFITIVCFFSFYINALTLEDLVLQDGFQISIFAENIEAPRQMTQGDQGFIFVGSRKSGKVIALFDSDGNVLRTVNFSFLDSPSTSSQCTYTTQIATNGSNTVYINRSASDTVRGSSSMICMEVLS